MSLLSPTRNRLAIAVATGASIVVLLSACSGDPSDLIETPKPSSTSAPSGTAKPSTAPEPSEGSGNTAVDIACDSLLTAQAMYDYNPNFGADPGYSPAEGTAPASAAALDGVSCSWVNQSSGEVIEIAVAQPSESALTGLKNDAVAASTAVPTYGVPPESEGYFTATSGVGEAQLFTGGYWIVARSAYFVEPGDVAPLFEALVPNLP